MKSIRTTRPSSCLAALRCVALSALACVAVAQTGLAAPQAQGGPLNIPLSGPDGKPSTLVYSVEAGWRLHEGWGNEARADAGRAIKAVASQGALPAEERPMLERPLTVFVDGPTGYTFIYILDQGWKFVGRIADEQQQH